MIMNVTERDRVLSSITLYECITGIISLASDAVVLNSNKEVIAEHSREENAKDEPDIMKYKDCIIMSIGINEKYPNKLVIYINE